MTPELDTTVQAFARDTGLTYEDAYAILGTVHLDY